MKKFLISKTWILVLASAVGLAWSIPQLMAQEDKESVPLEENVPGPSQEQSPEGFEKNLVDIPPQEEKPTVDASDFRDPFFFLRGENGSPREALTPGTTIDGIKFNSYNESQGFTNRYYQNSNFVLKDVYGRIEFVNQEGGCLNCHRGIEEISENHRFSCIACHGGNLKGKTTAQAHRGLVSNPSDLKHAPQFCGKCHADHIRKVQNSLMTTARGVIEITREAWGETPLKQSRKTKKGTTPRPWTYVSPGKPVDDFLQKKCLRCHVQSASPHRSGDYRATGCASCHMVYTNEGTTLSRDRAIQQAQKKDRKYLRSRLNRGVAANGLNNRRGYPLLHKFTVAIPSVQCEHCHNNNGVGNEFEGLFGKPARLQTVPAKAVADQPVLYGRSHEFLLPDIHREKGMHCIDCHGPEEVKADASDYPTQHDAVKVRCETCHGTNSRVPEGFVLAEKDSRAEDLIKKNQLNPNLAKKVKIGDTVMKDLQGNLLPHVLQVEDKWILYSKVTGKEHEIPLLKTLKRRPYAHQILGHMRDTECSACHARWSASEWGMHVIRENTLNQEQWRLWSFSDPTLQQLLFGSNPGRTPAGMLNWNSAQTTPTGIRGKWTGGIWSYVFSETGWNNLILGKNQRKRFTVMKPRYQYFVTTVSKTNDQETLRARVPITRKGKPGWVMTPHTPHTIRSTTRPCESCHENPLAAGLGEPTLKNVTDGKLFFTELKRANRVLPQFQIKQMVSTNGWSLQYPLPEGKLQFMKSKEINSLLKKSKRYRAYHFLTLRRDGQSRLLNRNEFPYDLKHKANEKEFGEPGGREALLYYDLDQHRFFETQRPAPTPQAGETPQESPSLEPEAESETPEPESAAEPQPGANADLLPSVDPKTTDPSFFIDLIPEETPENP